jgi:hypothetical protein
MLTITAKFTYTATNFNEIVTYFVFYKINGIVLLPTETIMFHDVIIILPCIDAIDYMSIKWEKKHW